MEKITIEKFISDVNSENIKSTIKYSNSEKATALVKTKEFRYINNYDLVAWITKSLITIGYDIGTNDFSSAFLDFLVMIQDFIGMKKYKLSNNAKRIINLIIDQRKPISFQEISQKLELKIDETENVCIDINANTELINIIDDHVYFKDLIIPIDKFIK